MLRYTKPTLKMATTRGGMRRILKHKSDLPTYIRQAVQTGIYRPPPRIGTAKRMGNEEKKKDIYGPDGRIDPYKKRKNDQEQFINDYPKQYEILTLNPPIPTPPRVPKKFMNRDRKGSSKREQLFLPTDPLIKNYLKRYDAKVRSENPLSEIQKEELKIERLLDGQHGQTHLLDDDDSWNKRGGTDVMNQKSTILNNAYNFAIRQYEIMRTKDCSEKESLAIVEELLAKEAKDERMESRRRADEVKERSKEENKKKEGEVDIVAKTDDGIEEENKSKSSSSSKKETPKSKEDIRNTLPSILHSKPRTIAALSIWSGRLRAVPYHQWTIGATVALDHWIACDVLGMTDDTWNKLLSGTNVEEKKTNLGLGHDVVLVRGALFPETMFGEEDDEDEEMMGADLAEAGLDDFAEDKKEKEEKDETEKSIEELLASLGGGYDDDEDKKDVWKFDDDDKKEAEAEAESMGINAHDDLDKKIYHMVEQLQKFRAKNMELDYVMWEEDEKKEFNTWLNEYISLVSTESDGTDIDVTSTRNALLSQTPTTPTESSTFWDNVRDETQAEIFLQSLLKDNPPTTTASSPQETDMERKTRDDLTTFLSLPYDVQLQRLIDLGTLRPIYDEYNTESDRLKFMSRYGDILLEGTEVEHLVPDKDGPITMKELRTNPEYSAMLPPDDENENYAILEDEDTRFAIKKIPYGTNEFGTDKAKVARELFRMWNVHKSGRAKYEEHMFKKGKLGLKYVPAEEDTKKKK